MRIFVHILSSIKTCLVFLLLTFAEEPYFLYSGVNTDSGLYLTQSKCDLLVYQVASDVGAEKICISLYLTRLVFKS
jgi:hypothetical protein